jgi:hypothetical protein
MTTVWAVVIPGGAVYNPLDRVPTAGVDQATPVFVVPVTVAVICVLWDEVRVALGGLILMLTLLATS